jgi:Uma2 family endonuclease
MQTAATGYDLVLDPAAYRGIKLLAEDGIPMESFWHYNCMSLLIDVALYYCRERTDYFVGGNNFIYFNPDQARNRDYRGPDFFYIKSGVDQRRPREYWAIWEESGRTPDVIVELLSPTTEREDRTTKFNIYEQTLRTPEYFLYDRDTERLDGWRLIGSSYVALQPNERGWLWSEELGLWLGTWVGEYKTMAATWLRMYTPDGVLVPTALEAEQQRAEQERLEKEVERQRAEQERQRAEQERQRAEQAERELARLRASLQQQTSPKNGGNP